MKRVHLLAIILIAVITLVASAPILLSYSQSTSTQRKDPVSPVYVGVAFCGNTTTQAEKLIDRVKSYSNLFILDCGINPISRNLTAAREILDYAVNANMSLIINLGKWTKDYWQAELQFLLDSRQMYGEKFLSVYYDDEPGGVELDYDWPGFFFNASHPVVSAHSNYTYMMVDIYNKLVLANATHTYPDNYSIEAEWFDAFVKEFRGMVSLKENNFTTLTADYALYWFDYKAGYDIMLGEIGWNSSITQQIALTRGAATLQHKEWGVIITWKYMQQPYLDSADNIYNQLTTAYNAGAKYITIFNYPQIGDDPYGGAMTDAHFQALEKFWDQVATKKAPNSANAEAALVLPKDYGWGMRVPNDRIWGIWGPDDKSPLIWTNLQTLLKQYGARLDVVYGDPAYPLTAGNYSKVYYWNQTVPQ